MLSSVMPLSSSAAAMPGVDVLGDDRLEVSSSTSANSSAMSGLVPVHLVFAARRSTADFSSRCSAHQLVARPIRAAHDRVAALARACPCRSLAPSAWKTQSVSPCSDVDVVLAQGFEPGRQRFGKRALRWLHPRQGQSRSRQRVPVGLWPGPLSSRQRSMALSRVEQGDHLVDVADVAHAAALPHCPKAASAWPCSRLRP